MSVLDGDHLVGLLEAARAKLLRLQRDRAFAREQGARSTAILDREVRLAERAVAEVVVELNARELPAPVKRGRPRKVGRSIEAEVAQVAAARARTERVRLQVDAKAERRRARKRHAAGCERCGSKLLELREVEAGYVQDTCTACGRRQGPLVSTHRPSRNGSHP